MNAADDDPAEDDSAHILSSTNDDLVVASQAKLQETAASLCQALRNDSKDLNIRCQPCTMADAVGYRCRCSLQIIQQHGRFHYAVRERGKPVVITNFNIANARIQQAMQQLLHVLNNDDDNDGSSKILATHLTSVSFVTSWNPSGDCYVTLHYHAPLEATTWTLAAQPVATRYAWRQLSGRAKRQVLRALSCNDEEMVIHDTLYLQKQETWKVSLYKTNLQDSNKVPILNVEYVKPESAFSHPNATVMCQALAWMLNRIQSIVDASNKYNNNNKVTLMELYSGAGAHTMALLRSGLLQRIVAVELDERLVQACRRNALLNHFGPDVLQIVSQDAGVWSTTQHDQGPRDATILLVDPPKQGLDDRVCHMAAKHHRNLQHILYISCGRQALVRDLQILQDDFGVVDCVLLDLFPQTYSVESLVHLQRRRRETAAASPETTAMG